MWLSQAILHLMLEATGLNTCLVQCDKCCQIITGISNTNLAFQDWKTCTVKGICETSCYPSCQSWTKRFPFYVIVHALKQNKNCSPFPWALAEFLEHILWQRMIYIYYVYSDMYTDFSFITTQSSPGEEKRKQTNKQKVNWKVQMAKSFIWK